MTPPSDPSPTVVPLAVAVDLEARLRGLGEVPVERAVAARHLAALDLDRAARRRRRRAAVVGVVGGAFLLGSTSLAAAGVLPAPAQSAAHDTLGRLGIDVPSSPDGVSSPQGDAPGRGERAADRVDGRGLGGAAGAEARRRLGAAPVGHDDRGGGAAAPRAIDADRARAPRSDPPRSDGQGPAGRPSDARAPRTRAADVPARAVATGRDGTGAGTADDLGDRRPVAPASTAQGSAGARPPSVTPAPPVATSGADEPSASTASRPAAGVGDEPTAPHAAGRLAGTGEPPSAPAPAPSPGVHVPGSGVAAPRDGANP